MVVDASVWVSRLVPPDVHHQASRAWMARQVAAGGPIIAPVLLLAEVAGAVSRRTGEADLARRAISTLLKVPNLRLAPLDARLGARAAKLAGTLRLRGADAVYVALAHQLRVPLVTWDREQRDRSLGTISARTPDAA